MSHKTLATSTVLLLETKHSIPKSIAGISARYGWGINIAPKNCKKLPMYSFADCRDELLQAGRVGLEPQHPKPSLLPTANFGIGKTMRVGCSLA